MVKTDDKLSRLLDIAVRGKEELTNDQIEAIYVMCLLLSRTERELLMEKIWTANNTERIDIIKKKITPDIFQEYLNAPSEAELIIYENGEVRIGVDIEYTFEGYDKFVTLYRDFFIPTSFEKFIKRIIYCMTLEMSGD